MLENKQTNPTIKGNPLPGLPLKPPSGVPVPNPPKRQPQPRLPDKKGNKPMFSVTYNYVRGRQLEGTYNSDPKIGYWPITSLRISRGWGAPLEERWPYSGGAAWWPPEEPPNIDQYAREHKIFAYQRVRSSVECKLALAARSFPTISVEMTSSWATAKKGKIRLPSKDDEINGSHGFFLVGFDDRREVFKFQNSWGIRWGDKGYGYLPYKYVDRLLTEAWVIILHEDIVMPKNVSGTIERIWAVQSVLHGILHGIELRDSQSNDRIAWSFATQYDDHLNIEELFVRPMYRGKRYSNQLVARCNCYTINRFPTC